MARRIRPTDLEQVARDVLGPGPPKSTDLHAEVARLREAMARAGAELTGAVPPATPAPAPSAAASRQAKTFALSTNALRKAVRTGLQIALAALAPAVLTATNQIHGTAGAYLALAITPAISFGQNYLEDRNLLPPMLRNPPT